MYTVNMCKIHQYLICGLSLLILDNNAHAWLLGQPPTVSIDGKTITGKEYNNNNDAFYGIPYAVAPTGANRFKPPVEKEITENLEARSLGNVCIQEKDGKQTGEEDCLFLNIYKPKNIESGTKLPVMFWVHGGSFHKGNGGYEYYGPDYFLKENVIVVTINYRLGVFGFLSAPEKGIYGNMGLKDQRAALKWVNKYIDYFGGDKSKVTLFGESAGAGSIHYLMMDPKTKELYDKAILQSGTALNPWAHQINPEERYKKLVEELKQDITDLSKLQNLSAKDIFSAAQKVPTDDDQKRGTDPVFNPVVEKLESNDPIITHDIFDLMGKRSRFPDKQVLMGYNSAEGLLALDRLDKDPKEIDSTLKDPERVIPDNFKLRNRSSEESVKRAIENLLASYTQTDNTRKYIDLMGDAWFDYGIFRTLQSIIKTNGRSKKTYFYKLSDDSYSVYKTYILTKYKNQPGVCHGDDLGYLFKMYYAGILPLPIPRGGHKTNQILVKFWVNFAKNGDPNSSTDETLKDITWQPVNKNSIPRYLDITKGNSPSMTPYTKDEKRRKKAWDALYQLGRKNDKKKSRARALKNKTN